MNAPAIRNALVFVGVFIAVTALLGAFGWLGPWELLAVAALAAVVTFAVARVRMRRRPGGA